MLFFLKTIVWNMRPFEQVYLIRLIGSIGPIWTVFKNPPSPPNCINCSELERFHELVEINFFLIIRVNWSDLSVYRNRIFLINLKGVWVVLNNLTQSTVFIKRTELDLYNSYPKSLLSLQLDGIGSFQQFVEIVLSESFPTT